jgi:hypothetical protein
VRCEFFRTGSAGLKKSVRNVSAKMKDAHRKVISRVKRVMHKKEDSNPESSSQLIWESNPCFRRERAAS